MSPIAVDKRRGAASFEYLMLIAFVLPLAIVVVPTGRRIIQLVYELTCLLVAWPFA